MPLSTLLAKPHRKEALGIYLKSGLILKQENLSFFLVTRHGIKLRLMKRGLVRGEAASPMAAPARASDVSGLPPAYLNVGVEDLFRDEVMAYARRLMAANVPTELALFPGMYHAGEVFTPTAAILSAFYYEPF